MSRLQANMLLLVASAFWGFGNVAQKTVLEHLDPMSAVGLRCLIGAALLLPFMLWERRPGRNLGYWLSLLRVGAPFALALAVQQAAYLGTSVTNASFLINTATVITPIAAWLMLGERPTRLVAFAAAMTLAGALFLSGGFSGAFGQGDAAAIAAAFCFAVWMVELSRHMQEHGDPATAACVQFFLAAVLTLPFGAFSGNLSVHAAIAAGPELLVLGVFSTAVAFGIQTIAQRFTSSSHAAVIVSAESVFGALGGALVLGERMSSSVAMGAALVMSAILLLALASGRMTESTRIAAA